METLFLQLSALLVFICTIIYVSRKKRHPLYPPGPVPLPIIGNLFQLGTKPQKVLLKWCEEYGDVFSFKIGSMETIVLNDAKIVKEVFSKAVSAGRTSNPVFQEISKGFGIGINEGPPWEEQRRFTLKTLKNLGFAKTSLEDRILEEVNCMLQYLKNRVDKPIPGNRIFNGAVFNIIWSIVAGERTDWDVPHPPEMYKLAMDLIESFNRAVRSGLMFAPFLRYIAPGFFGWNNVVNSIANIHNYAKQTVTKHREKLDPNNPMDFIDHYLLEIYNTSDPNSNFYKDTGEKHLLAILFELFLGGSESVSHTLSWTLAYLANSPNIQRKLQAEVDAVIGQSRRPSLSDKPSLPYTEATITEILRITSFAPTGVPHKMMDDAIISGYFFPKNSSITMNSHKIHFDKKIWGDPENFRPERFLSKDGSKFLRPEYLFAFSYGKRVCPGEHLAKDALLLFITSIMQMFDIKPAPHSNLEQLQNAAIPSNKFANEPEPFNIIVSLRKTNL